MGSLFELESLGNKLFDGFLLSARHRHTLTLRWCVGTLQNAALGGKNNTHLTYLRKKEKKICVWTILR